MTQAEKFNSIIQGQFPEYEAAVSKAAQEFKRFLREGPGPSQSIEAGYAERYMDLLKACCFDEQRAQALIEEFLDGCG